MNVKTYRAKTMQEALALVRRDLGPQASVLHTREVRGGGLMRWIGGPRLIEVVASTSVSVPSRLPPRRTPSNAGLRSRPASRLRRRRRARREPTAARESPRASDLARPAQRSCNRRVDDLCRRTTPGAAHDLPRRRCFDCSPT